MWKTPATLVRYSARLIGGVLCGVPGRVRGCRGGGWPPLDGRAPAGGGSGPARPARDRPVSRRNRRGRALPRRSARRPESVYVCGRLGAAAGDDGGSGGRRGGKRV